MSRVGRTAGCCSGTACCTALPIAQTAQQGTNHESAVSMISRYSSIFPSMVPAVLARMLSRSEPKLEKAARAECVESMACGGRRREQGGRHGWGPEQLPCRHACMGQLCT